MTTIDEATQRLNLAKDVADKLEGTATGGLSLYQTGAYTVVSDDEYRWLCETEDYEEASQGVISDILDGYLTEDDWYSKLCGDTSCIYSTSGFGDLSDVAGLEADVAEIREIFGDLGEDYDAWKDQHMETEQ